jgi:hypothetical protein
MLMFIAHAWHIISVLNEVKSFLEKKNEDDEKRLAKTAGRLRHHVREVWRKGGDEDELKRWRDKIEDAAKYFHVCITYFQSTGSFDYLQVAATVHNHDSLRSIVFEMQQTRQDQTARLEEIRRVQEEIRRKQEEAQRAQEEVQRAQEEAQRAQEEARQADQKARQRQEEIVDWGNSFLA